MAHLDRETGDEQDHPPVRADAFYLDGPLYYLEQAEPGRLGPVLVSARESRALLLFRRFGDAQQHLAGLPEKTRVYALERDDLRAKEEVLYAAALLGAGEVWLDVAAAGLEPSARYPLARALAYVRSFKRQSACF